MISSLESMYSKELEQQIENGRKIEKIEWTNHRIIVHRYALQ
jgi:hypothetical protein